MLFTKELDAQETKPTNLLPNSLQLTDYSVALEFYGVCCLWTKS